MLPMPSPQFESEVNPFESARDTLPMPSPQFESEET
jgi:hypothetical protein